MTGITRRQAAEAAAALFGATARQTHESRTYDPWEVMDREGKAWRFVYDASIRGSRRLGLQQVPTGDGVYKVEMNSPKLEYSELGKLQEVVRALRRAGAVVNESCGMHVHVDASRHTPRSLKNALSIMYSKEDILFKALNVNERRVERWCQKVREPMLEKIRKLPANTTMERLKREWYEGSDESDECKNRHPSPICTRFEHHFHALKPHLHRRSFSDTLPENQRHLIALKRHPLWHMQKLCQLSQPAELRSTFFRNRNAVLCQDVLQLSNPLALSLEFFLSCVKVFHRLTLHLVVAGPFQF